MFQIKKKEERKTNCLYLRLFVVWSWKCATQCFYKTSIQLQDCEGMMTMETTQMLIFGGELLGSIPSDMCWMWVLISPTVKTSYNAWTGFIVGFGGLMWLQKIAATTKLREHIQQKSLQDVTVNIWEFQSVGGGGRCLDMANPT